MCKLLLTWVYLHIFGSKRNPNRLQLKLKLFLKFIWIRSVCTIKNIQVDYNTNHITFFEFFPTFGSLLILWLCMFFSTVIQIISVLCRKVAALNCETNMVLGDHIRVYTPRLLLLVFPLSLLPDTAEATIKRIVRSGAGIPLWLMVQRWALPPN